MATECIRIYVPEARVQELAIRQALDQVVWGGATLYHATGIWNNGWETVAERVIVVEVLDCDEGRWIAIDQLATALLSAGEEAVLIARLQTTIHLSVRQDGFASLETSQIRHVDPGHIALNEHL